MQPLVSGEVLWAHVHPLHPGKARRSGVASAWHPPELWGSPPIRGPLFYHCLNFFPLIQSYSKYNWWVELFVAGSQIWKLRMSTRNFYGSFTLLGHFPCFVLFTFLFLI